MNVKSVVKLGTLALCGFSTMISVCSCDKELDVIPNNKEQNLTKVNICSNISEERTRGGLTFGTPWDCGDPTITWAVYRQDGTLVEHNTYTHTGGASNPISFNATLMKNSSYKLFVFFQKSNLYKVDLANKQITYNDWVIPGIYTRGVDKTNGLLLGYSVDGRVNGSEDNMWESQYEYAGQTGFSTPVWMNSNVWNYYPVFTGDATGTDAYYFFGNLYTSNSGESRMDISLTSPFLSIVVKSDKAEDNQYLRFVSVEMGELVEEAGNHSGWGHRAPWGYNFWTDYVIEKSWCYSVLENRKYSFVHNSSNEGNNGVNGNNSSCFGRVNVFRRKTVGDDESLIVYLGQKIPSTPERGCWMEVDGSAREQVVITNNTGKSIFASVVSVTNTIQ